MSIPTHWAEFAWDPWHCLQTLARCRKEIAFTVRRSVTMIACKSRRVLIRAWPVNPSNAPLSVDILYRKRYRLMQLNGIAQKLKFKAITVSGQEKFVTLREPRTIVAELEDRH